MSDEEERRKKRERNNQSVRKCRENEKKRVDKARDDLVQHKQENKELEEKYSSLKRELEVLKSLFHSSASNSTIASAITSTSASATVTASVSTNGNSSLVVQQANSNDVKPSPATPNQQDSSPNSHNDGSQRKRTRRK